MRQAGIKLLYSASFILACFYVSVPSAFAGNAYDVQLKIINPTTAELRIIYPISGQSSIAALSSRHDGDFKMGYRTLISATAQDGSDRAITHNTATEDAQIAIQPNDTSVTLLYRLGSNFGDRGPSLFSFLLFFGGGYPAAASVSFSGPADMDIITNQGQPLDISSSNPQHLLSARTLSVVAVPKRDSLFVRRNVGNFSVIGSKTKVDQAAVTLAKLSFADEMFKDIFGIDVPRHISIVFTELRSTDLHFEITGIALDPDVILIDPENFSFGRAPNDASKVIIHEVAHLALDSKGIFLGAQYNARWLDEGLAVFAQEYAADKYLLKTDGDREVDAVFSSQLKPSLSALKTEYSLPFDYQFSNDSQAQPIGMTYAHAGLIWYNMYLKNRTFIPRYLDALVGKTANITCTDCDTAAALSLIQSVTGLSKDEVVYPYKNDLTESNAQLSQLIRHGVDLETERRIKESASDDLVSYAPSNATAEEFKFPRSDDSRKPPSATRPPAASSSMNTSQNRVIAPISISVQKPISFFAKFRSWVMSLFR
ncbi:MAG: Pollen coat oleosin-glycine rich protein [Candidatus Taylorbacteria bacterium]|nr:Pollen coat oleosin-glycine rich protein [Candidatus Taylorbacteria bacterium]